MLSQGVLVSLVHVAFAAPLLYYAGWCMQPGKKCVKGFDKVLMAVAVAVFLYHGYKLMVRLGLLGREAFVRQGGYLGYPLGGQESFVPFSHPYQKESNRYYSFHDTENKRDCGCSGKCTCGNGCHHTASCRHNESNEGFFDTSSPASESRVGSGHM